MKDKFFESLVNQQMTGNLNAYIMKILKVCVEAESK